MTEQAFWKPEPKEPWSDWRTYSMLIPVLSSALGACLFLALGFSFTEIATIPLQVKTGMVLVASFTVAFGATFGSVGSGIEIFRKVFSEQVTGWDWISLGISTATTVAGFAMGFAALLGATAEWSQMAVIYGSLVVGTLAALDSSGDMIELGGLFGSYVMRVERWREERQIWLRENGQEMVTGENAMVARLDVMEVEIGKMTWPVARLGDFEKIRAGMNGQGVQMTTEQLAVELDNRQMKLPSPSTVTRWLSMVEE